MALYALAHTLASGRQAILLAPTTLLAKQHFAAVKTLLANLGHKDFEVPVSSTSTSASASCSRKSELNAVNENDSIAGSRESSSTRPNSDNIDTKTAMGQTVQLLLGESNPKDREALLQDISSGLTKLVVGTHALLQADVLGAFKDLALVVVDEEQRFGVAQRSLLVHRTNVMYTTATPIPRSLSLLSMNNYSVSSLHTSLPAKRPVMTRIVDLAQVADVYRTVAEHVPHGTKVFWVVPCLNPSTKYEGSSAMERYQQLSQLIPGKVGLLHGKMLSNEKDQVLEKFAKGSISVLVTTTVIEVGIGKFQAF